MISYGRIIWTIPKMKTTAGRKKAFSTCGSHRIVILSFFGSIIFMYVWLKKSSSLITDRTLAVVCSVLTLLVNPIIYSLHDSLSPLREPSFRNGRELVHLIIDFLPTSFLGFIVDLINVLCSFFVLTLNNHICNGSHLILPFKDYFSCFSFVL